jgi:2-polyprenyl-3-methyl-5-hydroxy-6-metoxy-1,4-benzoquinol methylase
LRKCSARTCALVWLDPFPVTEDIPTAYETYYTHDASAAPGRDRVSAVRNFLYRTYRVAVALPGVLVGIEQTRISLDSMFLAQSDPGVLLDVGCGDGSFLACMQSRGWDVAGVDFDAKAIATAKRKHGLDLHHGDLADVYFPADTFDAITLNHVIEHVPRPLDLLLACRRILKPGGRLIMATPNSASMGHQWFGCHWRELDPPRHLHIFSPANLAECARRAGFHVLRADSTAAHADIIIGASYSIRDNPDHRSPTQPPPNLTRTLKAVLFQFREQVRVRKGAEAGEEVILICARATA